MINDIYEVKRKLLKQKINSKLFRRDSVPSVVLLFTALYYLLMLCVWR